MKNLLSSSIKSLIIGISFSLGIIGTAAIAVTVSTTFSDGDTLSASSLNVLKTAVESIPNWEKGTTTTDAVYTDGTVGIGTSSPGEKLEVNGNVNIGGVTFGHQRFTVSNWTVNSTSDVVHGLGMTPLMLQAKVKLKVALSTYAIGDEIYIDNMSWYSTNSNTRGISIGANSTNIHIRTGEQGILIIPTGVDSSVEVANNTEADIIIDVFAWGTP